MTTRDWIVLLGAIIALLALTYCMGGPNFRIHPETRQMTER